MSDEQRGITLLGAQPAWTGPVCREPALHLAYVHQVHCGRCALARRKQAAVATAWILLTGTRTCKPPTALPASELLQSPETPQYILRPLSRFDQQATPAWRWRPGALEDPAPVRNGCTPLRVSCDGCDCANPPAARPHTRRQPPGQWSWQWRAIRLPGMYLPSWRYTPETVHLRRRHTRR